MEISEENLENIAKSVTLKEWIPFAERITKACEKETSAIMRYIRESDKYEYAKSPPENIALFKKAISKNLNIIVQIEKITKGLQDAEKKIINKTTETTATAEGQ